MKALVVLNFQPTATEVTVDLTNVAIGQAPINLLTAGRAARIDGPSYPVAVPARGVTVLAVD